MVNFKFVHSIIEHTSLILFDQKHFLTESLKTNMFDFLSNYPCEKSSNEETTTMNDILSNNIGNEIQLFLAQIQEDDDVNLCQCCIKFPTKN